MPTILTLWVGANRGIGLHLVKTFIERGWTAHGTIRPQSRDDPSVEDVCTMVQAPLKRS